MTEAGLVDDPRTLRAPQFDEFITRYVQRFAFSTRQRIKSAMKGFTEWLVDHGELELEQRDQHPAASQPGSWVSGRDGLTRLTFPAMTDKVADSDVAQAVLNENRRSNLDRRITALRHGWLPIDALVPGTNSRAFSLGAKGVAGLDLAPRCGDEPLPCRIPSDQRHKKVFLWRFRSPSGIGDGGHSVADVRPAVMRVLWTKGQDCWASLEHVKRGPPKDMSQGGAVRRKGRGRNAR